MLLINHLRASVLTIGEHCGIPEPAEADYVRLSAALESLPAELDDLSLEGGTEYAADRKPATPKRTGSSYSEPGLLKAGSDLVDEMVSSGLFDWADLVVSIQTQLDGDEPFITPKQFRALKNIAERGKIDVDGQGEENWWTYFEADYSESAKVVLEQARLA